jgi:hypothetical protein
MFDLSFRNDGKGTFAVRRGSVERQGRIKMGRTDHLAKLLGETAVEVWTDIPRARIAGKWLRKDEDALATAILKERNSAMI